MLLAARDGQMHSLMPQRRRDRQPLAASQRHCSAANLAPTRFLQSLAGGVERGERCGGDKTCGFPNQQLFLVRGTPTLGCGVTVNAS
jgi:hypothetical protein